MEPTCRVEQHATCNHCQAPILSRAANQRLTNQKPSPVSDDWLVSAAMSWFCESNSKLSVSPHLPHMWTQTRGMSSQGQMSPCETLPTGSHVPCPASVPAPVSDALCSHLHNTFIQRLVKLDGYGNQKIIYLRNLFLICVSHDWSLTRTRVACHSATLHCSGAGTDWTQQIYGNTLPDSTLVIASLQDDDTLPVSTTVSRMMTPVLATLADTFGLFVTKCWS